MATPEVEPARIGRACGAPEFLQPWLGRFYSPAQQALVAVLVDGPLSEADARSRMAAVVIDDPWEAFLRRCERFGVICVRDDGRLETADFHRRYEYWALFEGWADVPDPVREKLNLWELDAYAAAHADTVAVLKAGGRRCADRVCPEYVLLHEAEALLGRVAHVYLWPCNCRAMMAHCRRPTLTCLRFDNERGIGWEISHGRAVAIVREANRRGLMQSAELGLGENGRITGALCNCCSDCCFPHQLAQRLSAERIWPNSRYLARIRPERCSGCGRCASRCPFGAITMEKQDADRRALLDVQRCRGCGLCATGCREQAVEMRRVGESIFENFYRQSLA